MRCNIISGLAKLGTWGVGMIVMLSACGPPLPPEAVRVESTPAAASRTDPKTSGYDTVYFLQRFNDFRKLAEMEPGERLATFSSHNPNNQPDDANVFLGEMKDGEKTWYVMADQDGPGCIVRMFYSGNEQTRVRIYLDNMATPVVDSTLQDFFGSKNPYTNPYLFYTPANSGNGYVCYFPFPFAEHCLVVTDAGAAPLKYDLNLLTFNPGTRVTTFKSTVDDRLKRALAECRTTLELTAVGRFQDVVNQSGSPVDLLAKQNRLIVNASGPSAIKFFAFQVNPFDAETVSNIRIKMYWDRLREPAVDCSIREFFCSNVEVKDMWNSLPMGLYPKNDLLPNGLFYCQFYMPFAERAQVVFENHTDKDVKLRFVYSLDQSPLPEHYLYFYAHAIKREMPVGLLFPLMEFSGEGKYVGTNLFSNTSTAMSPKNFVLEGDEYFYVDGEEESSWKGTGLDNYFNGDKGFAPLAPFWGPTHGCLYLGEQGGGQVHAFRFHMLDAIPFSTSLLMVQEMGCPDQFETIQMQSMVTNVIEWTNYWYGREATGPVPRKEEVYYYAIDQIPNNAPSVLSPVMINKHLKIKLPTGSWWIHYAPVWDPSQVVHQGDLIPGATAPVTESATSP